MKNLKIFCLLALMGLVASGSCKKKETALPFETCKSCDSPTLIKRVVNLKGIVRKVGADDYFFNGGKYYIEVNLNDIPEIRNTDNGRIFPCCPSKYDDSDVGKEVTLNTNIYSCFTGNHGRPNNINYIFNIFN